MKKTLFVICLLVTTICANAQSIKIGARAGLNLANQSISSSGISVSPSSRVGFLLGGYATIMVGDKLGVQPELFYSSTGAKYDISGSSGAIRSNYLTLPVFLRYNVTDNFHLLGGPQYGILLAAKSVTGGTTIDIKDGYNSSDFGLAFGAGVDFGPLNAGIRYNIGLSNIEKDAPSGETIKNNVFQIVAGFKLFGK